MFVLTAVVAGFVATTTRESRNGITPVKTGHLGCFLLAVVAVAWATSADRCLGAPPATGAIDINELFERTKAAVAAEPLLEGAWLEVDRDDEPGSREKPAGVVFSRVLDATRADRQAAAMQRIIAELVPSGRFRLDVSRDLQLPVSELRSAIERLISQDTVRFDGCRLIALVLRRNAVDGRIVVVPRFRVLRAGQFSALVAETNRLMGRSSAWEAAEVSAVDTDPGQADFAEDAPAPDPNFVLAKVVEAMRANPALKGAWLTVDTDDQGFPGVAARLIVFRRTLDAGRVGEQSTAIENLVRSLVPNGRFRIDTTSDRLLPLSALVAELRRIMDIDPAFAGCAIESVAYVPISGDAEQRFDVLLQGRVWKNSQVRRVAELCSTLLAADPVWDATRAGVSAESAKTLVVVAPDAAMAASQYSDAMHHFWAGDYAGADRRLAMASLDDPANIVYRYWRVIGALAAGDQVNAEDRLRRTIIGFGVRPGSVGYVDVLRSIYRIQGPLRMALIAAERRAMTEASLRPAGSGVVAEL
jgi:hypothetical protein